MKRYALLLYILFLAAAVRAATPRPQPLYIVNGKETSEIRSIPPEDIENVEMLPADEETIARYGQRAAHGVMLITLRYDRPASFPADSAFGSYIARQVRWDESEPTARVVLRYKITPDGETIVQQDGISRFDVTGQFSVGNGTAVRIALHLNGGQGEFLTGGQMDPSTGKVLQTNLRALGIQHGRHRGVQFFPQRLQRVQPRLMLRVGPVGKVEAGHVHSRLDHLPQDAFPVRGGAKGTYNLCLSHLTHSFRHFKRNADSLPL